MPSVTTDGSSTISESQTISVITRDGGLCVLCGMDLVDVGQIIAGESGDQGQVNWIRRVAPSLSNFTQDDPVNLICFCPTHHSQYNSGYFVLVPSRQQRELLLEHEHRDFAMREGILAQGGGDPGRTFPALIDEFEYIPVREDPFRIQIHNPTPYDPFLFVFDNIDHQPCPLLHFRASHIALMVAAKPHLSNITRLQSPKGDMAEPQIADLLRLYQRQPGSRSNLMPPISVPSNYEAMCSQLKQPKSQPTHSISLAKDGPMPASSSASTDDWSQTEGADVDLYAGADIQLAEYAKERSITWEDLKNRPPLFGSEELGLWRFSSADDICRSKQL